MSESNPARKKIQFEKSVQTFNAILDAVASLVTEVGVDATSIQQVSKKSGYAVGTIYLYFDNKESFLEGLLRREVFKFQERLQIKMLPIMHRPPEEIVLHFFETLLNDKQFIQYKNLFGMAPLVEGTNTGLSISKLIVDAVSKELTDSLKFELAKEELNRKSFLIIHALRGLLSIDYPTESGVYAQWLACFAMGVLQDSKN